MPQSSFSRTKYLVAWIMITFTLCINMKQVFAGSLLVTNVLSNSVTIFNEETLTPIKEIAVGFMPHEVAVSPNGKLALVANFGDLFKVNPGYSLSVIDILNGRVLQTIMLPKSSRPHGLVFINDEQLLVTAQGIQSLLVINLNGKAIKTIPLPGAGAHMVKVDSAKRFAYVASVDSGTVAKIDLKNFAIIAQIKIGKEAEGLALTASEDLLFVTDRKDNKVTVVRAKDLAILKNIATAIGPVRIEMFDNGKSAVVANTVSGNLQIIDIATLTITKTFSTTLPAMLLPVPINIVIRQDQTTAFITNAFAGNITLMNLLNGQILKTFKAGLMPDGVAVSEATPVDAVGIAYTEFTSGALDINASPEVVWQIAKNVEEYNRLSRGAITAHIDGKIAVGKKIKLILYKDKCIGKFIPESEETVTVVDEDKKILAWVRKLSNGEYTERYQILEKISDHKTRSLIVLRIPGLIGAVTKKTLGKLIDHSFRDLNEGMKDYAERLDSTAKN